MISAIESGLQDPRYATLTTLLNACGEELDLVPLAGQGVDRTQFIATLKLTPTQRLRAAVAATRGLERLRRSRRIYRMECSNLARAQRDRKRR